MHDLIQAIATYFETISSVHRALILVGGLTFFWLFETALPLYRFEYHKWKHALLNLFFTLTTVVVNFAMAIILFMAAEVVSAREFGLLYWLGSLTASGALSLGLSVLIGLMILDLISAWFAHWIQHKVRWMWKFHLIHHTDTHVDATSANRHHPGESVVRFLFTTLAVLVTGAPMWMVLLYQSLSVVLSQFNHANISLPEWMDRAISWFIVSPNMHKVHHHYVLPYTDSNYGNIFSVWDRLFGTFMTIERDQLVYGVDTHMHEHEHANLVRLLMIPFQKYRKATTDPDGRPRKPDEAN